MVRRILLSRRLLAASSAYRSGGDEHVLGIGYLGSNDVRLDYLLVDAHLAQNTPHDGLRVVRVVDRETLFQPDQLAVLAKHPHADGVKRPHPERSRRSFADEFLQALAHLSGRFVGECHGQDAVRRDALLDQVSDPVRQATGLAAARPREDEDGAVDDGCSFTLGRIQPADYGHIG